MEFDIEDIICYIRGHVPAPVGERFSDDDLVDIVDAMVDYDFEHGLLDLGMDADDELSVDIDGIVNYVSKRLKGRIGSSFSHDDLRDIVNAELEYEDSIFD